MSFLEKLGLNSKKHNAAPAIGENKKKKDRLAKLKESMLVRIFILLSFLTVLFLSIPHPNVEDKLGYSIGEPWKADDLIAPFTFAIQKSEEELNNEQQSIRENTPPIFRQQPDVDLGTQRRINTIFERLDPVLTAYSQWRSAQQSGQAVARDSLNFFQKKNNADINLSESAWSALLQNYRRTEIQGQRADTKTASDRTFIGPSLQRDLSAIASDILNDGIINRPKEELQSSEITIRNLQNRTEQNFNTANLRDIQQASEYARSRLSQRYNSNLVVPGIEIFNQAIAPNLDYSEDQTQERINEALAEISTTKGAIAQGQVIIRNGDLVTQERYNILQSLSKARSQTISSSERWMQYSGDAISILAIVVIFFFYLYLYRRHIFMDNAMLLLVLLVMSIICIASSMVYQLDDVSLFIIPVAIAPIILTIIFDSRVGILSTVTLALLIGLMNSNSFEFVTATIVGCCLGLFSVRDIKKRSQFFFTTPGIVFLSYGFVITGFSLAALQGWNTMFNDLVFVAINAIFILFTYPLILLFEKTFKITTDLTLIELSDTNLPLLKKLMNKAPGTFHHSLQVANLAEAAAGAIRANGLLCRVAALYHDIGKMENPAYFAENQLGANEHDKLKPRMSALVIKAHVSNGEKLARELKLPELLIDFIKTHHGTSVIKYFYEKAKEQNDDSKDEIHREDFTYDGPLPDTKETGILMLADGVEAASRAMKDPNYQKLENLIDKMVDDRVAEGQLSHTPLTFQDLSVIKETFLNILVGIYHSRVEYPEDSDEKGRKKKTPSSQSSQKTDNVEFEADQSVNDYYNS